MLKITLQEKQYNIRDRWDEITLDEFLKLSRLSAPESLIALYRAAAKMNTEDKEKRNKAKDEYNKISERLTADDILRKFPEYYGNVIKLFSDIPGSVIDLMHRDVRTSLFDAHLRQYVLSMFYNAPVDIVAGEIVGYLPEETDRVKIGREVFYLPETLKIDNEAYPNYRTDVLTFAEASAIEVSIHELKEDTAKIARFCAVYLRKKGEKYSDDMVLKHEPLMLKMKMSDVWTVFFCIIQLSARSMQRITMFSKAQEIKEHISRAELQITESEG